MRWLEKSPRDRAGGGCLCPVLVSGVSLFSHGGDCGGLRTVHFLIAVCSAHFSSAHTCPKSTRLATGRNNKGEVKGYLLPVSYCSDLGTISEGVGWKSGSYSSTSARSPSTGWLPLRLPFGPADASLPPSSVCRLQLAARPASAYPRWGGSRAPVVHLVSARGSRIVNRPFHLPVSFLTSALLVVCCAFHSRQL